MWSVFSIRPLRRAIFILGLGIVAFGFAVLRRDVPETSFDEADIPVNQTVPVALGIKFVPPARLSVIVPRPLWMKYEFRTVDMPAFIETRAHLDPLSLPNLLCTFLC
jgi:hypothetical protein